ncbi:phosphopantetheine-binding protein [Nonomuraea sp. NPDC050786]|uniref:phosphopantetheine-binding protein n=1 Tax=Nonomuraea sp. NPDC050786 TaxID=3154840 RepID=UPI0033F56D4F
MSDNLSRADTESAVLLVLCDVIGNDAISLHDDFYMVGGHSLLILKIRHRLRNEFSLDLDLRQFWVNARVDSLVSACRPVVRVDGARCDGQ